MAHAISPGCLGAAWLVPEMVLSATTPASISNERNRLGMGLNLGGEGFENQQYDDEERNRQIHPVGFRNQGGVIEFKKRGAQDGIGSPTPSPRRSRVSFAFAAALLSIPAGIPRSNCIGNSHARISSSLKPGLPYPSSYRQKCALLEERPETNLRADNQPHHQLLSELSTIRRLQFRLILPASALRPNEFLGRLMRAAKLSRVITTSPSGSLPDPCQPKGVSKVDRPSRRRCYVRGGARKCGSGIPAIRQHRRAGRCPCAYKFHQVRNEPRPRSCSPWISTWNLCVFPCRR